MMVWVQVLSAVVSIAVVLASLLQRQHRRMVNFTLFALAGCLLSVGYGFGLTASTLDGAIIADRLVHLGSPFIITCAYLFVRDYCNVPVKRVRWAILLNVYPLFISVLALSWPLQNWYYTALSLNTAGPLPHLEATHGPLYLTGLLYAALFAVLILICIARRLAHTHGSERRHILFLLCTLCVPIAGTALAAFGLPNGFNPASLSLSLFTAILCVYLTRIRSREWQTLGRSAAVQNMHDAFILVDIKGGFLDANRMAAEYFPAIEKATPGTPIAGIEGFPDTWLDTLDNCMDMELEKGEETLYLRASRSFLELDGNKLGTSILIYDNTENHLLLEKLQELAAHDALTGLYNRGTFFTFATRDFDLCLRKFELGSVLMIDIDHFKLINDQYGHAKGDEVLRTISHTLHARLRHTDISGRYGGEELLVWLPGASAQGAMIIADVIRRAVEHTPFSAEGERFGVTVSIGVASMDHTRQQTFDMLVREADAALYRAKAGGRNLVRLYERPTSADEPS